MRFFIATLILFATFSQQLMAKPRILELIPEYVVGPVAIDPAIPKDFVLVENPKISEFYWGKKEILQDLIKNEFDREVLKEAVIMGRVSCMVSQKGENSFSEEPMNIKDIEESFTVDKLMWGAYPVRKIKYTLNLGFEEHELHLALVGLNSPSRGVLEFILFSAGNPTSNDLALWETFITKTKQLSEQEFYEALGYDLQEGYTIVTMGRAKLKVIAEERISDHELRAIVEPLNSNTQFTEEEVGTGWLQTKWKSSHPIVVFRGSTVYSEENRTDHYNQSIMALIKKVDQFSDCLDKCEPLVPESIKNKESL